MNKRKGIAFGKRVRVCLLMMVLILNSTPLQGGVYAEPLTEETEVPKEGNTQDEGQGESVETEEEDSRSEEAENGDTEDSKTDETETDETETDETETDEEEKEVEEIEESEKNTTGISELTADGLSIQVKISASDPDVLPEGTEVVAVQAAVSNRDGNKIATVAATDPEEVFYQSMIAQDALILDMAETHEDGITVTNDMLENIAESESELQMNTMVTVPLDISLSCEGKEIQPGGMVEVSIQIPEGIDMDSAAVYHVPEEGTPEKMKGQLVDGSYVFATDHFSVYTLVGKTAANVTTAATRLTAADRGKTMSGGNVYYIENDVNISYDAYSGNGLAVAGTNSTNPAVLFIPYGKTLTVTGSQGGAWKPGAAAINLPSGETLYIRGGGTLVATGGQAGKVVTELHINADAYTYTGTLSSYSHWSAGTGGTGGTGGGGGGAGIGTNGAQGPPITRPPADPPSANNYDWEMERENTEIGTNGNDGENGKNSESAGTVYVLDTMTVKATGGGSASVEAGSAAGKNADDKGSGYKNSYFAGGGGGGTGGVGGVGAGIGSGGGSGGAGGAGGNSGLSVNTGSYGKPSSYPSGGGGGGGSINGSKGGGTQRLNGGKGGKGGTAGTSGSGGTLYLATTATCSNYGGSGINGRAATLDRSQKYNAQNSYYTITLTANAPSAPNAPAVNISALNQITLQAGIIPSGNGGYAAIASGWDFKGWYTAASGGLQVIDKNGYLVEAPGYTAPGGNWVHGDNATLYAQWTPGIYQVYLSDQGADATKEGTQEVFAKHGYGWYGTSAASGNAMSGITIPQKRGNTFLGYYSEPDSSGTQVITTDGIFVADSHNDIRKTVTFYARWEATPYRATVNMTLDSAAYENAAVALYQYGYLKYTLDEDEAGEYWNDNVITGEYNIFVNGRDTGRKFTIDAADNGIILNFKKYTVNTKLNNVASKIDTVTLRQNGVIQYTADYSSSHIATVLQSDTATDNIFDVYVGSEDTGLQVSAGEMQKTVEYFSPTVMLTYDTLWTDAKVTLRQNNKIVHTLIYDDTADDLITNTTTYQKPVQGNTDNDVYDVYINGMSNGQTVTVSTIGFEQGNHITRDTYFKVAIEVKKDNAAWTGTSVYLYYAGKEQYTLQYNSGQYCFNYVQKNADDAAYDVWIDGSISGQDTGARVNAAKGSETVEYYTVSYYNKVADVDALYITQVVRKGAQAKKPSNPGKKGVSFNNWYEMDANGLVPAAFVFEGAINDTTNLWAVYEIPGARINGYMRCDSNGTMNGAGSYYRMVNFGTSGYPGTGSSMQGITLTVTNGKVSELGTVSGSTTYNNIDSNGNGTYSVVFSNGISLMELESFVHNKLLVQVVNDGIDHKMKIGVYGKV